MQWKQPNVLSQVHGKKCVKVGFLSRIKERMELIVNCAGNSFFLRRLSPSGEQQAHASSSRSRTHKMRTLFPALKTCPASEHCGINPSLLLRSRSLSPLP